MAPIKVQFGETRVERIPLSLTRADKDRILQNFPEKISVSVANFGAQDYPLRSFVKSFLDQVQLPTLKIAFEAHGQDDDVVSAEINAPEIQVIGTRGGNFKIADTEVFYDFDADIRSEAIAIAPCTCDDDQDGQQASRKFTISWSIEVALEPGVSGLYEVADMDVLVAAPCCRRPPETEIGNGEVDDEDESGKERKKSKKKHKYR